MADGLPHPSLQESSEIAIDCLPRRKSWRRWRMAPPTPSAHNMEQAVQHLPHIGGPRPTAGFRRWDERLDQAVLIIAQGLTGAKVPNQHSIPRVSTSRPPEWASLPFQTATDVAVHPRSMGLAALSKR